MRTKAKIVERPAVVALRAARLEAERALNRELERNAMHKSYEREGEITHPLKRVVSIAAEYVETLSLLLKGISDIDKEITELSLTPEATND